jgi:hypothetical protein
MEAGQGGKERQPAAAAGGPARRATRATRVPEPAQPRSAKRSKAAKRDGSAARSVAAKRGNPRDPASLLLKALQEHGVLDNTKGRAATGLDGTAVRLLLQQLVGSGQVRVVGRKRGTRYLPVSR